MTDRWSVDQVLALAPDPASQKAARGLATRSRWDGSGIAGPLLWGECKGSGKKPYQSCVDLSGPAYRCSCPSRKFPCKHALALLLLWSGGDVAAGDPPDWAAQWHESRQQRAQARGRDTTPDPDAARRRAARRAGRVADGLAELDRWLGDQVRQGLAGQRQAGYQAVDAMAARLVDAQAPGAAAAVRRLSQITGDGDLWASRMLEEMALLRLLAEAYRRVEDLPADLAATVRSRVGFTVSREDVLAGRPVRDRWQVVGMRDEPEDHLTVRRVWLFGAATGRPALVLSFATAGQALTADLVPGTVVDADLAYHPGAVPLRAVLAASHAPPGRLTTPQGATSVTGALERYATAVAADPWLDRWPVLLAGTVLTRHHDRWYAVDAAGDAMPLHPSVGEPWRLVAAAGGEPAVLSGEWSPDGLRPLSVLSEDRLVAA